MAKDPVCGMVVEETPGSLKSEVRGTTFYFCSQSCQMEFLLPHRELAKLKTMVLLGAGLTIPVLVLTYIPLLGAPTADYILLFLAVPIQFVVGSRFYRGAYHALRARTSNMDVLVAVGTSAAFGYSAVATLDPQAFGVQGVYFDAAAVIITLILAGRLLEHLTKERATDSVRKLLELRPGVAHLIKDGEVRDVPLDDLVVGDMVQVKPGEKVAADGLVRTGRSNVDESLLTGESSAVPKEPGSQVIGSSINLDGSIVVEVSAVGNDSVIGQIAKLVEEAKAGKAPIQRLADRISEYFVPVIIVVAVIAALGWRLVAGVPISTAVLVFVSVVIIACPCALGIATPAALLVGTSAAARKGILVRGGEAVEAASHVDTVLLDKTGTVTKGRQSLVEVLGTDQLGILRAAASIERASEHPLATAIVNGAAIRGIRPEPISDFVSEPGLGVAGRLGGKVVKVGRRDFVGSHSRWEWEERVTALKEQGLTVVFVSVEGGFGAIAVGDAVKEDAAQAVRDMSVMGLSVAMLTGDDPATALAVAKSVGISVVKAGLLPSDKAREVERLQAEGRVVAMVGDGINDAPALAKADLGIAIGSGTDVAKETGGMVLVRDRLGDGVTALRIGRATMKKIRQNLVWAFGYNIVLVPVAAGALIPFYGLGMYSFLPFLAGVAMALSSVSVVANSLLLRYDAGPAERRV